MWETPKQSIDFCGDGFWGIPDASVDFCEEKYIESYWVGEYYNTLSSLMYICVAIPFLFTKIKNINDMIYSAKKLIDSGAKNVLLKGGHLKSNIMCDIFLNKSEIYFFKNKLI